MWLMDTLQNLVSGLGGVQDKSIYSRYVFGELSKSELDAAYRSDWVARKTIDIPAYDATRKWRMWVGDEKQIEALEAFEREFFVQQKLKAALTQARLYGGAAIVMGVGQGQPNQELDLDAIAQGDLEFIHVVNKHELRSGPMIDDIMDPFYGEPQYYERNSTGVPSVQIHPSRVVRLVGNPLPERNLSGDGWGDSVLQSVDDAVRAAGVVSGGIAAMVNEAKIDVIKIPNLTKNITTKEYKDRLVERFQFANRSKSIVNTLVLDGAEEWQRITQSFNTLPDVLQMYLLIASGAADIPATRFLGQSPAGMNSTGESDIRNYYDRINAEQTTVLSPALSRLDEVIIRTVTGNRDPNLYYEWHSLWQLDDTQKATINKTKADTFKVDFDAGLIDPELLRKARIEQLIEDGVYPGFEQLVDEAKALEEQDLPEEIDPTDPQAIERQRQKLLAAGKDPALLPAPAPGPSGGGHTVDPNAEVQKQALNGTQISSLMELATEVKTMALEPEVVKAIITVAFPALKEEEINAIIDPIVPEKPEPPPMIAGVQPGGPEGPIPTKKAIVVPPKKGAIVSDAQPRTLYVRRDVVNHAAIQAWAKAQGFKTTITDMHVTLAFSRTSLDWMKVESEWYTGKDGILELPPGGARLVEELGDEGAIVLLFNSSELSWRHEAIKRAGATWDYPEFQPHITITYDRGDVDLSDVEPYRGPIVLGPEIFEEIKAHNIVEDTSQRRVRFVPVNDSVKHSADLKTIIDGFAEAFKNMPQPTINLTMPSGKTRTVKDVKYEGGRAVQIVETEEDAE